MSELFSSAAFANQTILITGATGGIGSACTKMFYDAGATVVLCDLDANALETLASRLGDRNRVHTYAGDITLPTFIDEITATIESIGGLNHLILAAGVYQSQPVHSLTDTDFDRTLTINLRAVFQLSRALLPCMDDGGSIVNFSSITGQRGAKYHAHYAASKAALVGFGRSLAWEVGHRNIRVNSVSPGVISTSMTKDLIASNREVLLQTTPLQRYGTATEVASAVMFLASSAASFITGANLEVNGGLHMG